MMYSHTIFKVASNADFQTVSFLQGTDDSHHNNFIAKACDSLTKVYFLLLKWGGNRNMHQNNLLKSYVLMESKAVS